MHCCPTAPLSWSLSCSGLPDLPFGLVAGRDFARDFPADGAAFAGEVEEGGNSMAIRLSEQDKF